MTQEILPKGITDGMMIIIGISIIKENKTAYKQFYLGN